MNPNTRVSRARPSTIATHQVLRNTYLLLSMTLLFSALVAYVTMVNAVQPPGLIISLVGMFGLSMLTQALRNSPWGIASIFAFTGFMGYILGPMLHMVIASYTNGQALVFTSLGATGVIFFALSNYVLTTGKDFTFMGGMLSVAIIVAFLASLGALFFQLPILHLVISGVFALISSGMILYQTSAILEGGERNYIMATISLYISLFNLFVSLLRIFAAFAGQRD